MDRLAHYRIVDKLGAGGMGEVYRAHDERLDREVAIKVLPTSTNEDPIARARLLQEARAAAALNHPHICTVYEVGEAEGQAYIAMELVDGQPLSERLRSGPLPGDQVLRFGLQLAEALAHAHERGVVHRDLKSANILVKADGRVKVLDFGLAKRLTPTELTAAVTRDVGTLTQPGTVMGTVAYMAPEQLRGEPAQMPSDIWAFGVVLHEMATGARPFQGQTGFELSAAILGEPPLSLPEDASHPLRTVVGRCLRKEPRRRYRTGGQTHAALEALANGQPEPAAPDADVEGPTRLVGDGTRPHGSVGSTASRPSAVSRSSSGTISLTLSRRRVLGVGLTAVVALVAGLLTWQLWPAAAMRSLAVLPFANTLADEDTDYLAEGIADALIRQVAGFESVSVRPLSTTLSFKGQAVEPDDAGRQLGVEAVLAGTLSVEAGQLAITARLVDVETGTELWSNTYNRDATQLLDVQDEIASAILDDGLRIQLSNDERAALVRGTTRDGEAYDLFLQAQYLQRRGFEEDYLNARELLDRATARDPEFALAWVVQAGIHAMMVVDGYERPTDGWAQANRYLRRALALDPTVPEALAITHGQALFFDWDWEGAAQERRAAMESPIGELDPGLFRTFALELWALGRPEEALDMARRSRELDPLNAGLGMLEADYLVHAGRLDDAVAVYQRAIEIEPESAEAYFGLGDTFFHLGRFDEANEARRQAHALAGDSVLAELFAVAQDEAGYVAADRAWVRVQLEFLEARSPWGYVSPLDFARAYAQLGETDLAFEYLEQAFVDRSPGLVFLNVDRAWDNVRDDARFDDAVVRVGLPVAD